MNREPSKPSCKIKIEFSNNHLPESYTKISNFDKSIDFYTLLSQDQDFSYDKETDLGIKNLLEYKTKEHLVPSASSSQIKVNRSNTNFLYSVLNNDIRVRDFTGYPDIILINFCVIEDAISFYMQYFEVYQMKFVHALDLNFEDDEIYEHSIDTKENNLIHIPTTTIFGSEEESLLSDKKPFSRSETDDYYSNKENFDSRVEYFNKMKSVFTKSDYKKIEDMLSQNKYEYFLNNCKELSVGANTNVLMQNFVKAIDEDLLFELIKCYGDDIAPISATKYGAYVVQILLSTIKNKDQQTYLAYNFKKEGKYLVCHEIGNYTIQKIIRFDEELIFGFFIDNFEILINDAFGFKIFKRCFSYFKDKMDRIYKKLETCTINPVQLDLLINLLEE